MKKQSLKQIITKNRKLLRKGGIPANLLTMYANPEKYHDRRPCYDTALKIAAILNISVMKLPWSKTEVNKP